MTSTAAVATNRPAHPQRAEEPQAFGFGTMFLGMLRRMAAAYARASTMRRLSALDDHTLRDIGLTRSQIGSIEHDRRYSPRTSRTWN